jgi:flagellar FliL protein
MEMAELSSAAGRKKAKHELVEQVTEAYEGEVMDIYFTEFVMQ